MLKMTVDPIRTTNFVAAQLCKTAGGRQPSCAAHVQKKDGSQKMTSSNEEMKLSCISGFILNQSQIKC